jgi:hypothetical protein
VSEDIQLPEGLPDEAYHLGEPIDAFRVGFARTILFGLIILGSALALIALSYNWVKQAGKPAAVAFAIGLVILAVWSRFQGIHFLNRAVRERKMCVLVFRHGLVYLHEGAEVVRWDDVATFERTGPRLNPHVSLGLYPYFILRRRSDGREFVFDGFLARVRKLARLIENGTRKPLR